MPGPFIFIATNRIRDGRFGAEQQRVPGLSHFIEANEPRLIAFNEYVNEDHSEVTVVQVHPDAASLNSLLASSVTGARRATPRRSRAPQASKSSGLPPGTSFQCSRSRPDR